MLMHVHKNILDNINLTDVVHEFVNKKIAANKQSDIFLRIIHNIYKIKLKLWYFLYIYISYQMYRQLVPGKFVYVLECKCYFLAVRYKHKW